MQVEASQTGESKKRIKSSLLYINPFEHKNFLERRIMEGYYGPTASLDRSEIFEYDAIPFIGTIKAQMTQWEEQYKKDVRSTGVERDKKLAQLASDWEKIPKGGIEEQNWTVSAVATVASAFEHYKTEQSENSQEEFSFFDNQLYYMSLMTLDKGTYDFGELSTKHRAVQLDTGEGKTICSGVLAGILSLKQQPVHIIEQNYLSALEHGQEMAPFLEQYLHISTGVVVDLSSKSGIQVKKYFDKDGLLHVEPLIGDGRESYTCLNNTVHKTSRDYAWRQNIVYTDTNSLSIDTTLDSRIGTKESSGIPPLKNTIALVQEADDVMIDRAQSPSVIDKTISGKDGKKQSEKVWDTISNSFLHIWEDKNVSVVSEQKRKIAQDIMYRVWTNISQLGLLPDFFVTGKEKSNFVIVSNGVMMTDDLIPYIEKNINPQFVDIFGSLKETNRYFRRYPHILQTAVQIYLGHRSDINFISGKEPVLMDQHGVPLDKRQLRDLEHIFLQLNNIWQEQGLSKKKMNMDDLDAVMKKTIHSFSVSQGTVARKYPSTIFKEYGTLRMTSGSLIPVAETMKDVYGAETLTVSRHNPIPEQTRIGEEKKLITKCLDGGEAEVQFVDEKDRPALIAERISDLQEQGRSALIIMPNAVEANDLERKIQEWIGNKHLSNEREAELALILSKLENGGRFPREEIAITHPLDKQATQRGIEQGNAYRKVLSTLERLSLESSRRKRDILGASIRVVSGREELKKRGTLSDAVSNMDPGSVIITTSMAHRDINPHLTKELIENGGMEVIVCGAANERGLWQALQRSIRSDVPGSRRLILTEKDMYPVSHSFIVNTEPLPSPFMSNNREKMSQNKIKRYEELWQKSNMSDISAKASMYKAYLGELRNREDKERLGLLYTTAREEHMVDIQKAYINKMKSIDWWNEYLDEQTKKWFYADLKKRNAIVPGMDVGFIQNRQIAEAFILELYWSEMLDTIDFESVRFGIESIESQKAPTILDYQQLWDLHMYGYMDKMKIEKPEVE